MARQPRRRPPAGRCHGSGFLGGRTSGRRVKPNGLVYTILVSPPFTVFHVVHDAWPGCSSRRTEQDLRRERRSPPLGPKSGRASDLRIGQHLAAPNLKKVRWWTCEVGSWYGFGMPEALQHAFLVGSGAGFHQVRSGWGEGTDGSGRHQLTPGSGPLERADPRGAAGGFSQRGLLGGALRPGAVAPRVVPRVRRASVQSGGSGWRWDRRRSQGCGIRWPNDMRNGFAGPMALMVRPRRSVADVRLAQRHGEVLQRLARQPLRQGQGAVAWRSETPRSGLCVSG